MDVYYVILTKDDLRTVDVASICKMIGLHDLCYGLNGYVRIRQASHNQIKQLSRILKALGMEFDMTKKIEFDS